MVAVAPIVADLEQLRTQLIDIMLRDPRGVREGTVMSLEPPYRRLDCDSCALAYLRVRPRKSSVKVDVSGLWMGDHADALHEPLACGAATLSLRTNADVEAAAEYLRRTIDRTRAAREAHKARAAELSHHKRALLAELRGGR